jgi:predicted alpha/beta hydrolase family esterase
MKHALIFHGTGGYPGENWFPWLKTELENREYQVAVPQFPTPEDQSLATWLKVLRDYKDYLSEDTIVIGHSLGGLFLLRVLEQLDTPIRSAFFIGTSVGEKPIKFYASDFAFSGFDFDWAKIRHGARHFEVWHSDNDPYVSLANGKKLSSELGVELNFIPNAGHFNAAAGYTTFLPLLDKIVELDTSS